YDALVAGDGTQSLRDMATEAGFPEVGSVGEDIGVQIQTSQLQPGDIDSVDGKDFMHIGDGKFIGTDGKIITADDLPPLHGTNLGYYRLDVDGSLAEDS